MSRATSYALAGAFVGLWLLVSLVTGAQYYFLSALRGQPLSLPESVFTQAAAGLAWFPTAIAVVRLARRFPLRAASWKRHLVLHLAAAGAAAFALNLLITALWLAAGIPVVERQGFWPTAVAGFLNFLHINVLVYAVIVAVVHGVEYYKASRERELRAARLETQLAQARLEALRAQLHPHFLFNALHTLGLLWRGGRGDEAQALLERLASLLRRALDSDAAHEVSLGDELEFVREYLEIESARFRDRLRVSITADAAVLEARVPAMLLQPLVENAIRHGVGARGAGGSVTVSASREADALVLEVRDDGPGMAAESSRSGNGLGLRITRERLERMYGGAGALDVLVPPAGGTSARVRLPFRTIEAV